MKRILFGLKVVHILSLVILLSACNNDEEKISSKQIRQALFDMKGTYHGNLEVAFYHGSDIVKIDSAKAISRDSLSLVMPLGPIADIIDNEHVTAILRDIEEVVFKAEYEFLQIDNDGYSINFVLHPKNIVIPATENTPDITIVFSDIFGGNFEKAVNFIMFNVSPIEIWSGGSKLDSFKQLVYHFSGEYE